MKASILIVEDEIIVGQHLRRLVERLGHRVSGSAATGAEALRLAREDPPDLALMDIRIQGTMNGIEVARRLRAESDTAIVFLTAYADAATLEATRDVEAAGYLVKPFEESEVHAAISTALAKEGAVRRIEEYGRDLGAILDQLEVGTAMLDEHGLLSYLSGPALELLGIDEEGARGRPWRSVLPLESEALDRLGRQIEATSKTRRRLPVSIARPHRGSAPQAEEEGVDERPRRLEIDIRDDPQDPQKRILFLYDVTERDDLRKLLEAETRDHGMVGRSPAMQRVFDQIGQVAVASAPVLVEGETGSGKELVARAIHRASPRATGPFVAVNCAGLSESLLASQLFGHKRGAFTGAVADHRGFFERANFGTLFLDEIGDISMSVQTSLLRVLEDGRITPLGSAVSQQVDVRIVTATHRDLGAEVEAGRFRADLVYRIRVARVRLPPLRERGEDLELLAHFFLDRSRAAAGRAPMHFSAAALECLLRHPWPGNVRELRSAVEHAVISARGDGISVADLPPEVIPEAPPTAGQDGIDEEGAPVDERSRILDALERAGGNRSRAARLLGISRATFYRRLDSLGIG